jgi:predicted N-formylglutamate amidohydrolase
VLPAEYDSLGLPPAAFARHIAYDIGAAGVTRRLADALRCPAVLTTFSRLLIDPNRGADDPTLIMRISDGAIVPGNARVDAAETERRRLGFWQPYRDCAGQLLDEMLADGPVPAVIAIHSFTPAWKGHNRPWHVGILWDADDRLARPTITALQADGDLVVGDNEPYDGALEGDTMYHHGTMRGLPHMLVEIRQDLVADAASEAAWAARLARILRPILADRDLHAVKHFGTRTHPGFAHAG